MSKYQPLAQRLQGHPGDEWKASFSEIEEVLGFPLPKTARSGKSWWTGADKPQAKAWDGWQADVDHAGGAVTFRKSSVSPVAVEAVAGLAPVGELAAQDLDMPKPPPPPYVDPNLIPAKVETKPKPSGPPPAALIAAGAAVVVGLGALVMRTLIRRR
jgi:hypothetical protein